MKILAVLLLVALTPEIHAARAPEVGLMRSLFKSGKNDAITDVKGVRVGHTTLIQGEGKLQVGKGPVRTGVTVILPPDNPWEHKRYAGSFVLNGNGEAMGLMWIKESGILETPIALTNTLAVANVQKGLNQWMVKENPQIGITDDTVTPVVVECDDSTLNDIRGEHVKPEHVLEAIASSTTGAVAEGSVGAGVGMISYDFKGGIGTASRVLPKEDGGYTVGVILNANNGDRRTLRVLGFPVGDAISDLMPKVHQEGSVVLILATDAPLESRQLSRLATRAMMGLSRIGSVAYHGSGDLAIAFSTANSIPHYPKKPLLTVKVLSDFFMNPLIEAAAEAAEEASLNALLAANTVVGRDGNTAYALPIDRLMTHLKSRGALGENSAPLTR